MIPPYDHELVIGVEIKLIYLGGDAFGREVHKKNVPRVVLFKWEDGGVFRLLPASQGLWFAVMNGHHRDTSIQGVEEFSQAGSCFELRDRVEKLESGRKSVLQAPLGAWREFRIVRLKIVLVNLTGKMLRRFEFVLDERAIDDLFRLSI